MVSSKRLDNKEIGRPMDNFSSCSLIDAIDNFRCGYIAIVGQPNVGKSTLMNELIGVKISITSRKIQTTRHRITGVHTTADTQFLYFDTPGFQTRYSNMLNRTLNRTVTTTLAMADVILYVVEANNFDAADERIMTLLPQDIPCILVISKSDLVKDKAMLIPFVQKISTMHSFSSVVPISTKLRFQLSNLQSEVRNYLPLGPRVFEEDEITDRSEKFLSSEIIREKIFRFLGDELPYTTTVIIENFELEGSLRRIFAVAIVERTTHKLMILGKNGERIKKISGLSRLDMERLFGGPVYLEVWIKVKSGWSNSEAKLRTYGYE
jgi:GTP-binding protein Era